jgi:hypothetical protein
MSRYRLLPLAELSRELGSPYDSLYRLVKARKIRPDQIAGRQLLFRSDRLETLLPVLESELSGPRFIAVEERLRAFLKRSAANSRGVVTTS